MNPILSITVESLAVSDSYIYHLQPIELDVSDAMVPLSQSLLDEARHGSPAKAQLWFLHLVAASMAHHHGAYF